MKYHIFGLGSISVGSSNNNQVVSLNDHLDEPVPGMPRWNVTLKLRDLGYTPQGEDRPSAGPPGCGLDFRYGGWESPGPVCFLEPVSLEFRAGAYKLKDPFRNSLLPIPPDYEGYAWSPLLGDCFLYSSSLYVPRRQSGWDERTHLPYFKSSTEPGENTHLRWGYGILDHLRQHGHHFFRHPVPVSFKRKGSS